MDLKNFIKSDSALETVSARVQWREGIEFEIRYITPTIISEIANQCRKWVFDPDKKARVQQLDAEAFGFSLARRLIKSWKGVTLRRLAKLMPLTVESIPADQWDVELEYNEDNARTVFLNAPGLDSFLTDCCADISLFQTVPEEVRSNSSSSPITS